MRRPDRARLGRNVLALSAVSLLTDVASEMAYPLLPLFLVSIGAGAAALGAVEGAAESAAALLRLASGWWSDRLRRRKPLVVAGYALASAARPLLGFAQAVGHVLAVRLADRIGKGIRGAPRDALIADSAAPAERGRAFGFQRAADHLGAVLGPLAAFALLRWSHLDLRTLFFLTAVPGLFAVLTVVFAVRETPPAEPSRPLDLRASLGKRFWRFLAVLFVFTLGNSSDAFLLLRAADLGLDAAMIPILWAFLHVVKSLSSTPGGALSDRIGRRPLLVAGWLLYAGVYLALGRATETWQVWVLFGFYGLYFGLTEGVEKALVADLVPAERRGTAFGWYNLALGLGAFPASLLFGLLWEQWGPGLAFSFGAVLALLAAVGLLFVTPLRPGGR